MADAAKHGVTPPTWAMCVLAVCASIAAAVGLVVGCTVDSEALILGVPAVIAAPLTWGIFGFMVYVDRM